MKFSEEQVQPMVSPRLTARFSRAGAASLLCGSLSACMHVTVAVKPANATVEPGGSTEFAVSVTRVGNVADVDLSAAPQPDLDATFTPSRLTASQDASMLTVTSNVGAGIGARVVEIQTVPPARSNRPDGLPTTATVVVGPCGARWVRQFGTVGNDSAGISLGSGSEVYVSVSLGRGALVAKLHNDGGTDWHLPSPFVQANLDEAWGQVQADGTIFFVGTVRKPDANGRDRLYVRVVKFGADRALRWTQDIGPATGFASFPDDLRTTSFVVDSTGITLVGITNGNFGGTAGHQTGINADGWMAKLGQDGALLWHRQTESFEGDAFLQVLTDSSGAIIVRGTRGDVVAFVAKYDQGMRQLWSHDVPFAQAFSDAGGLAVSTGNEIYALYAGINLFYRQHDSVLFKLDSSGTPAWSKSMGFHGIHRAYAVRPIDSAGEVLVLGTEVTSPITASGVRLLRMRAATGAFVARRNIDMPQLIASASMAIDGASNLYLAGSTEGSLGAINAGGIDGWYAQLDYSASRCWQ